MGDVLGSSGLKGGRKPKIGHKQCMLLARGLEPYTRSTFERHLRSWVIPYHFLSACNVLKVSCEGMGSHFESWAMHTAHMWLRFGYHSVQHAFKVGVLDAPNMLKIDKQSDSSVFYTLYALGTKVRPCSHITLVPLHMPGRSVPNSVHWCHQIWVLTLQNWASAYQCVFVGFRCQQSDIQQVLAHARREQISTQIIPTHVWSPLTWDCANLYLLPKFITLWAHCVGFTWA